MKYFTKNLSIFFKSETVLCISVIFAVISMFFVKPSALYFDYLDFRVLTLLFCLMAVVAGLGKAGIFLKLSEKMLIKIKNTRSLGFLLIMLCFFSSMWITNDVSLITFVPFAIMIFTMTGQIKHMITVIVLQTIAANLGSMLTPIGNPQNLYLYSVFEVPLQEFLLITLPITATSFLLLCLSSLLIKKETLVFTLPQSKKAEKFQRYAIVMYSVLFLVCLACVVRILDYRIMLVIVIITILAFDRRVIHMVDYALLLTFVGFFIFVGNLGNITIIKDFLASFVAGKELAVSIVASQFISNVPAAVLLSTFTNDYRSLILGTNIGGLGTIVASLASLISFKFYCKTVDSRPLKFLGVFIVYNIVFLILLCLVNQVTSFSF
ncbi:MAG: SLC13 family permease [Mobilitalea sp.]